MATDEQIERVREISGNCIFSKDMKALQAVLSELTALRAAIKQVRTMYPKSTANKEINEAINAALSEARK